MNIDPVYALLLLAGGLGALDRGIALAARFSTRIDGLRRWDRERAREIVEREERDEALARLADNSDAILDALGSNGKPLHDRVTEISADIVDIVQRLEAGSGWMRAHEELHERERRAV